MTGMKQCWAIERNHFCVLRISLEPTFMQVHVELLKKENKSNMLAQVSSGEITNHSPFQQVKIMPKEGGLAPAKY